MENAEEVQRAKYTSYSRRLIEKIKRHKLVVIILSLFILSFIAWGVVAVMSTTFGVSGGGTTAVPSIESAPQYSDFLSRDAKDISLGSEIEVKEGSVNIKSKDAETDAKTIESLAKERGGFIAQRNKSESNVELKIAITARMPFSEFDAFFEDIAEQFDIKSYNLSTSRIQVQHEIDEIKILQQALNDYEKVRIEIQIMPIGKEKIDLLMDVTNKELELKSKEKQFTRGLTTKEQRGDLATMNIMLKERLKADIWPENVSNRFRDEVKRSLDKIIDTIIQVSTTSIVLFFNVIKWILYTLIVFIPVLFTAIFVKKLFKRIRRSHPNIDN